MTLSKSSQQNSNLPFLVTRIVDRTKRMSRLNSERTMNHPHDHPRAESPNRRLDYFSSNQYVRQPRLNQMPHKFPSLPLHPPNIHFAPGYNGYHFTVQIIAKTTGIFLAAYQFLDQHFGGVMEDAVQFFEIATPEQIPASFATARLNDQEKLGIPHIQSIKGLLQVQKGKQGFGSTSLQKMISPIPTSGSFSLRSHSGRAGFCYYPPLGPFIWIPPRTCYVPI